ncbi:MAG: hypothetical protein IJ960_06835 [Oscillospiraceae bacterium]|nr:hypothetical protein [Oscillospiraceae bacterium]
MKETIFQRLCWHITRHRLNRKYAVEREGRVYCRCRICGKHLWREIKLPVAGRN